MKLIAVLIVILIIYPLLIIVDFIYREEGYESSIIRNDIS